MSDGTEAAGGTEADVLAARDFALREYAAGRRGPMEVWCQRVLATTPGDSTAATYLSAILLDRGDPQGAINVTRAAVAAAPDVAAHRLNLAHYLIQTRGYTEALEHAQKATVLEPDNPRAWINLSSAMYHAERYPESIEAARRVIEITPDDDRAYNNLATSLKGLGQLREAIAAYRRAIELKPKQAVAHTNLLLTMMYDAETPTEEIAAAARHFAAVFERPLLKSRQAHRNAPLPDRRLRLGFLSPDFSSHAVMYFAEPLLSRLPRTQFEIYCYHLDRASDNVTARLRGQADAFREIAHLEPAAQAALIRDDGIDILIDLAGHTAKNGLLAMAHKPAPVQVTWLGYPGTTGLSSIDWRITDAVADPAGVEGQYTEGLVRLPGAFCVYRPHVRSALHRHDPVYAVAPAPWLRNGRFTFGSCNNLAKISDACLDAWSRILAAVPGAQLLIEGKGLAQAEIAQRLRQRFAAHGIEAARLILVPRDTRRQYRTWHAVDLALDSFPLTGGTTTFDALWMGVRVVSLRGRVFRERLSASILEAGGFGDDVTDSVDAYVARAVALAQDAASLSAQRADVRRRLQASRLMDEARFARVFGSALRMLWQRWCATQSVPTPPELDSPVCFENRRLTLAGATALMSLLHKGKPDERQRSAQLALAILECVPEHAGANALMATVKFVAAPPPPAAGAATGLDGAVA